MNFTAEDVLRARACGVIIKHDLSVEEAALIIELRTVELVRQLEEMRANRDRWRQDCFILAGLLGLVLMILVGCRLSGI